MPNNYYDAPALSQSAIKKYLTDGAHSFWRHSVFNPARIPEPETPFKLKGKAAHKLLLEPATFYNDFAVKQKVDGRTKEGKAYNEEFAAQAGNKSVLTEEEYAELSMAIAKLRGNADFQEMTKGDWMVEEEFFWEAGGIARKAKTDLIVFRKPNEPVIFDYKRCQNCDPAHFARDVIKFKYYMQSAYYKDAFESKYGARPRFIFIAQEWDYPENVGFYELQPADEGVGARELVRAAKEIKIRLDNGIWSAASPGVNSLELPTWFYTQQMEEELSDAS